jgi:hypothetical protein
MAIWCIVFRFGMLYQEKFGNPDLSSGAISIFYNTDFWRQSERHSETLWRTDLSINPLQL